MTALTIALVYLLIGVVALWVALRRRALPIEGLLGAAAMLLLWPFLAPGLFDEEPPIGRITARAEAIERLRRSASEALASEGASLIGRASIGGDLLSGFADRLLFQDRRLTEIDHAVAAALPGAQRRLEALSASTAKDLDQRMQLFEEVVAHLSVLRFVDLSQPELAKEERERLEALLVRVASLVDQTLAEA